MVYKAYINTAVGKELVAVKTGKGMMTTVEGKDVLLLCPYIYTALFSSHDMERMKKEVSAMLNFKHPNVMPLIGVCLDGEMPLIIMPFMSNGSVLEFVKSHREEMFLCSHAMKELVCFLIRKIVTLGKIHNKVLPTTGDTKTGQVGLILLVMVDTSAIINPCCLSAVECITGRIHIICIWLLCVPIADVVYNPYLKISIQGQGGQDVEDLILSVELE